MPEPKETDYSDIRRVVVQKYMRWRQMQIGLPAMVRDAEANVNLIASVDPLTCVAVDMLAWCMAEIHEAKNVTEWRYRTWWDHFKADVLPGWLLERYPAEKDEWTVFQPLTVRMCPHRGLPENDSRHIDYVVKGDSR